MLGSKVTGISLIIKSTTGDPAGTISEGTICINTFDNICKIYAEGAWRAITASW